MTGQIPHSHPTGSNKSQSGSDAIPRLRVMAFLGIQNLPIIAANHLGLFQARRLAVELHVAKNSVEMRNGLASEHFQIVHGAVDNAIAMVDRANVDVAVIMGGDNGFTNLYAQPDFRSYDDLRGSKVVVDAPDTAFALMLYKVLDKHGLKRGDYFVNALGAGPFRLAGMTADRTNAAAVLNPPFSVLAQRAGLTDLGPLVAHIGPYLSTSGFALRSWLANNSVTAINYIRAYCDALQWVLDPANRERIIDLMMDWLQQPRDVVAECCRIATDPVGGLAPDAAIDLEGLLNVISLRAEVENQWNGTPPLPEKYVDFSFHRIALATA